jgi:hypothetical protein
METILAEHFPRDQAPFEIAQIDDVFNEAWVGSH